MARGITKQLFMVRDIIKLDHPVLDIPGMIQKPLQAKTFLIQVLAFLWTVSLSSASIICCGIAHSYFVLVVGRSNWPVCRYFART